MSIPGTPPQEPESRGPEPEGSQYDADVPGTDTPPTGTPWVAHEADTPPSGVPSVPPSGSTPPAGVPWWPQAADTPHAGSPWAPHGPYTPPTGTPSAPQGADIPHAGAPWAPPGAEAPSGGGHWTPPPAGTPWIPISHGSQAPHAQQNPARRTGKRRRLRNSLLLVALLLAAAGGGVAAGRDTAAQPTKASASAGSGGSGGSSGGSSVFPGFGGLNPFGGSSGSTGSGSSSSGSTGVGAGGSSLNASTIAAKVDPAVVDVNVSLGYESARAAGTGIVLTSNGEVLTNNHVVDGATSISVTDVGNGRTYTGKVVGTDATQDIAVIQLQNASGLTTANIGDSSSLKSGEPVLAIGNAGGTGGTPSTAAGKVVALGQSITATDSTGANSEHLTGLVETDAPIQPGDSGGPLVNQSGQVLAIDTAASSASQFQSSTSQAFAIPINTALSIASQIVSGQGSSTIHIGTAAILGIEVEAGGSFSGSSHSGAVIAGVLSGSPAATAGLTAGDVIVSLDGHSVSSPASLSSLMGSHHPGDRVTVGFDTASGQSQTVTVTLAAGPPA